MQAVWSFWTKPYRAHHHGVWLTDAHHLFAWVLSVETAKRHYDRTCLVTDDDGAQLLVGRLGLEFTSVSTALTALRDANPAWWVLGKLWAYRLQSQPFVHIDNDVFLWKRLPERVERAAVFAQNPEWFPAEGESWYRPHAFDRAFRTYSGWTPDEWRWYTARRGSEAICCGILGGTHVQFLSYYARLAIEMIEHPHNAAASRSLGSCIGDNILFEQYLLAACLAYHADAERSRFGTMDVAYIFESTDAAFDETQARQAGYTHLIGGAKSNRALAARLEMRVRRDYPDLYHRALRCATF